MRDLVGQRIGGKYDVTQRLGGGAVADVYEAIHHRLGQRVAIKVLRKEFSRLPAVTRRFLTEGRAASAVRHPGIIQVFDVDQIESGELYIVMELLQGDDLSVVLERDGPFEPERAVEVVLQVLDALDAAHRAGVVHRDLKPENILLLMESDGRETAKIIDFGVARLEREGPAALRKTAEGTVVGTPYYISPEQARGESGIDHRTDVYAVGVILYEMLTGELPYTGSSVQGIIKHVLEDPFPRIRSVEPTVPGVLEEVILRATARHRDERYPSAAAFAAALRVATGRATEATAAAAAVLPAGDDGSGVARPTLPAPDGHQVEPAEAAAAAPARPVPPPPRRTPSQQTAQGVDLPKVQTVVVLPPRVWVFILGGAAAAAAVVAVLFLVVLRGPNASPEASSGPNVALADAGGAPLPVGPTPPVEDAATAAAADAGATTAVKVVDAGADVDDPVDSRAAIDVPSATVRLLHLPRGAAVTLDDEPVEAVFTAPIADTPRRLRVEAPGWKVWARSVRITGDLQLPVEMERRGAAAADSGGVRPTDTFRPLANPFGDA